MLLSTNALLKAARRSRHHQEEELRNLIETSNRQTAQVDQIEKRIEALVTILEDAGIALPSNISDALLESLNEDHDGNTETTEKFFEELSNILNQENEAEEEDQYEEDA